MTELSQRINENQQQDTVNLEKRKRYIAIWRYRVYIFFLVVIMVAIQPYFSSSITDVRGQGAFQFSLTDPLAMFTSLGEGGKINELNEVNTKIDDMIAQISGTILQIQIVKNLETPEKQRTILYCINNGLCAPLGSGLMDRIDLLRSFLVIEHLATDKLAFDQKFILRNINEFLAVKDGRTLVTLKEISFGEATEVKPEYKLFKVPVRMSISFINNADFMEFLNNVETKVYPTLPVMRRVESVNYDIVHYLKAQDVTLDLAFYYINTPTQNKLLEAINGTGTSTNTGQIDSGAVNSGTNIILPPING